MIQDVSLVVADIDGTLVDDKYHKMMPLTQKAYHILQDHGVYLGIASGRGINHQMKERVTDWGFTKPFELLIGLNGGEVYDEIHDSRKEFYKLKREYIKEIIDLMSPLDLNPFIYRDDVMVASRMDEQMKASSERNSQDVHVAKDISELYETDISKIMFRMPESVMPEAEKLVVNIKDKPYRAFKTQTTMLEFMDARINKGNAFSKESRQLTPITASTTRFWINPTTEVNPSATMLSIPNCSARSSKSGIGQWWQRWQSRPNSSTSAWQCLEWLRHLGSNRMRRS